MTTCNIEKVALGAITLKYDVRHSDSRRAPVEMRTRSEMRGKLKKVFSSSDFFLDFSSCFIHPPATFFSP